MPCPTPVRGVTRADHEKAQPPQVSRRFRRPSCELHDQCVLACGATLASLWMFGSLDRAESRCLFSVCSCSMNRCFATVLSFSTCDTMPNVQFFSPSVSRLRGARGCSTLNERVQRLHPRLAEEVRARCLHWENLRCAESVARRDCAVGTQLSVVVAAHGVHCTTSRLHTNVKIKLPPGPVGDHSAVQAAPL